MALDTQTDVMSYEAPEKDLYELGEIPPMGYVPKKMYAWAIRKERHGEPNTAMVQEVVDVLELFERLLGQKARRAEIGSVVEPVAALDAGDLAIEELVEHPR